MESPTFLTPYGYQSSSCGYCKNASSSQRTLDSRSSYYAKSTRLSAEDYQELLDRGWRRSGTLLYKPDQQRSCCPHYTIRLPAALLKPTRNQRQALHRWNKFVLGEDYVGKAAKLHPISKKCVIPVPSTAGTFHVVHVTHRIDILPGIDHYREKSRLRNEFDLLATIHESEYASLRTPPEPEHKFEVSLETNNLTNEKYELFEHYQRVVHKEPPSQISKSGFERFLCSSPLENITRISNGQAKKLGSFHQCYRVDGRLMAMGVLDLLPHAVSGVYFIYHEDFEKWSFGKLSALREAALAIEGGYEYYYMGYYIHSCIKMRYKGEFKPQYILDPESYDWDILDDEVKQKLDAEKYLSLSRDRGMLQRKMSSATTWGTASAEAERDVNDCAIQFPIPAEAAASGMSLFELRMAGMMTLQEVEDQLDLSQTRALIGKGRRQCARMEQLVGWENGSFSDRNSLKCAVAELAACVGPKVARNMIVEFG